MRPGRFAFAGRSDATSRFDPTTRRPPLLAGFTVILYCQFAGERIVIGLGLPIPGPIAGMAILFGRLPLLWRLVF